MDFAGKTPITSSFDCPVGLSFVESAADIFDVKLYHVLELFGRSPTSSTMQHHVRGILKTFGNDLLIAR